MSGTSRQYHARDAGPANPAGGQAREPGVVEAIRRRRSTRAFLPTPIDEAVLRGVLEVARCTPSRANAQPWRVDVVTGATLEHFKAEMKRRFLAGKPSASEYAQYPAFWPEHYLARRRACGHGLYEVLGVAREDREGRRRAMLANFDCFGAPAAFLIWTPRSLGESFWVDCGMFLQSLILAAEARGLASIAQGALAEHADFAHELFNVGDDFLLLCGVSLGLGDEDAPVNAYDPGREPLDRFVTWWR